MESRKKRLILLSCTMEDHQFNIHGRGHKTMTDQELYQLWCKKAVEDPKVAAELKQIKGNDQEIRDRFYADLEFGTAGLRGLLGAGTIRMNVYTVRRATQGYAAYLLENFENPSVAIAYDSRHQSDEFARETAAVFAANGVRVHIFPELMPTPVLSFAVRYLKASGGVVVTASHNPGVYNGYKAYGADGCQMTSEAAGAVLAKIKETDLFDGVKKMPFDEGVEQGLISIIGPDLLDAYLNKVQEQAVNPGIAEDAKLKVVYTPLNGTGNKPVREILRRTGVNNVFVVPEQEYPDGDFPTAPFPNPEIRQAFECAIKLAQSVEPDLLLATDPDADRVGIAVRQGSDYVLMSGNEVGAMLLNYLCSQRIAKGTYPERPIAIKTIVTTPMASAVAEKYGAQLLEVLTGFKYIGEQIGLLEAKGEENRFVLGFEESYGYLAGSYVRDKDAVVASMLICEMAAFYKAQGRTLYEVMQDLYSEFGYYLNTVVSVTREGADGMKEIAGMMASLRENPPAEIAGQAIVRMGDYQASRAKDLKTGAEEVIDLPQSDVLSYVLENGAKVIIRPSGTEPKIKFYYTAKAESREDAQAFTREMDDCVHKLLNL